MSQKNQVGQMNALNRRGRGWFLWLRLVIVLSLSLILLGAIYESVAEAIDEQIYPPSGQMVDVGGYHLHIHCTGRGSPTVVIDAGWGDWSAKWGWVQPEVAKTTQICTYDRAGMGYSEAGSLPRNAKQFAKELHTLLHQANIQAPYVLVGHSLGGLSMRVFAHDYAAEVAGVVLIESMSPAQFSQAPTDKKPQQTLLSRGFSIPAALARIGLVRLLAEPLGLKPALPPGIQKAFTAFSVTPRSVQAWADEGSGMPESGVQARAVKSFGSLPLIVLSRGLDLDPDWQAMQSELLQLSSHSQQLIAEKGGHNLETDQPEAAIAAIVKMIKQLR